jgi:GTP cyclohydrolase I
MEVRRKCDPELGRKVNEHLISLGLETPMSRVRDEFNSEEAIEKIQNNVYNIMIELGLDLKDDSLRDTPERVAQMYVNEIFWGLDYDRFPKCTKIKNSMNYRGSFVLERNINVQSYCEHHFIVIDGVASVAYIPNDVVLGLSKLNRIVQFFSKRPQVQERLTEQIRATIALVAETEDVAVQIDGLHFCVKSRGIQDLRSSTATLSSSGQFENGECRREFLAGCRSLMS